jgi:integrase
VVADAETLVTGKDYTVVLTTSQGRIIAELNHNLYGRHRYKAPKDIGPRQAADWFDWWTSAVLPDALKRLKSATSTGMTGPDPTIREVISHYCDTFLPAKNRADGTITRANQVLYDFLRFCAGRNVGRVSQLTPALIAEWNAALRKSGLSAKSVDHYIGFLRTAINVAIDAELIDRPPIRKWITPDAPDPEIWPLTEAEWKRLVGFLCKLPRIGNIGAWIALTGQRPSDARGLKRRNIDLANGVVYRTQVKTKQLAHFEISPAAVEVLKAETSLHPDSENVFLDENGHPFTPNQLYNAFIRAVAASKLFKRRVNLKDLRHTFCSLAANEWGMPIPWVQQAAGHRDINTTMKYIKPSSAKAKLAAAHGDILKILAPAGTGKRKPRKKK